MKCNNARDAVIRVFSNNEKDADWFLEALAYMGYTVTMLSREERMRLLQTYRERENDNF